MIGAGGSKVIVRSSINLKQLKVQTKTLSLMQEDKRYGFVLTKAHEAYFDLHIAALSQYKEIENYRTKLFELF